MTEAARPGRTRSEGSGFLLCEHDQLFQRFHWNRGTDDDNAGGRGDMDDGSEVLEHVVGKLVEMRMYCPVADGSDDEGMAIRARTRDDLHADRAIDTRPVIDHHRL